MRSKIAEFMILGAIYIGSGIFIGYSLSEEKRWNQYQEDLDRMMGHRNDFGKQGKTP